MSEDDQRQRLFSRRAALLAGGQGLLFAALMVKLYRLQVFQHERYHSLSERNRIRIRSILPKRGALLDRHGNVLAQDEPAHKACLIRQETISLQDILRHYCRYMRLDDDDYDDLYKQIKAYPAHLPYTLNDHLTWDQVVHLETQHGAFEGLYIDQGHRRFYLYGPACAHVLGYLGERTSSGVTAKGKVGIAGLEKICDASLAGIPGQVQIEVDARNKKIRTLQEHPAQDSAPVSLTLSAPLQAYAYERFREVKGGTALVIDVQTGELLVYLSVPGYDPNQLTTPFRKEFWNALIHDPMHPLLDKVVQGQYAPGSLFKPLVALAGLEAGVITPDKTFYCSGCIELNRHPFHCHLKTGHGHVDVVQALRVSCDVYFYELARIVGIQRIGQMAYRFGLGQKTALDFPGEQKGIIPNQEWKWRLRRERWSPAETLMTGIGQGYLLATPLQMAVMLARLANGTQKVQPRLFSQTSLESSFEALDVSPQWIRLIQDAMFQVCNVPGGTGYSQRIPEAGYEMAGKTATVQVKRITLQERRLGLASKLARDWHEREHAMFMAYAPAHCPRYGIYILHEHGGKGSQAAAPLARDILWQAQKMNLLGDLNV